MWLKLAWLGALIVHVALVVRNRFDLERLREQMEDETSADLTAQDVMEAVQRGHGSGLDEAVAKRARSRLRIGRLNFGVLFGLTALVVLDYLVGISF